MKEHNQVTHLDSDNISTSNSDNKAVQNQEMVRYLAFIKTSHYRRSVEFFELDNTANSLDSLKNPYSRKDLSLFNGEEIALQIDTESVNIFSVLDMALKLIKKYDIDFLRIQDKEKFIDIDNNYFGCLGATMIINRSTVIEKYKSALQNFIEDFHFQETPKYIYFTSDPQGSPGMDGFVSKYLSWKVAMNIGKYIECESWSYHSDEVIIPNWIAGVHDYKDGRFIIW